MAEIQESNQAIEFKVSTREKLALESAVRTQEALVPHLSTHGNKIAGIAEASRVRLKIKEIHGEEPKLSRDEAIALQLQIEAQDAPETHDGVNFSRIQIDTVLQQQSVGCPIEFETLSPYIADYDLAHGAIPENILIKEDAIGLRLASTFRKLFPRGKLISLYDEYNTSMPDSSADITGQPLSDGVVKQLELSPEVRDAFRANIIELLKSHKAISGRGEEGAEYLMVSESSKVTDAEKLVTKLESKDFIERQGEEIYFVNPQAENPLYGKILLRSKAGRWYCEALDAASFINPENLEATHIVVLPDYMKEQQDKVWEILGAIGIKPNNYHNIFYDKELPPEKIAEVIEKEFAKYTPREQAISIV